MYALGEVHRSWDWLIESLKLEEHGSKHKITLEQKSKKVKRVPITPAVTVKEKSPIDRITRSRKNKLQSLQKTEDLHKDFFVAKMTRT
jgi:hypothetical protein